MQRIRDLCVCEITAALSLSAPTVSRHLQILRHADLLWDRKDGKWVNYGLNKHTADPLIGTIRQLIKELIEDDPVFRNGRILLLPPDALRIALPLLVYFVVMFLVSFYLGKDPLKFEDPIRNAAIPAQYILIHYIFPRFFNATLLYHRY